MLDSCIYTKKKLKLLLFCEDDLFLIFLKCKISTLLIWFLVFAVEIYNFLTDCDS